MNTVPNGHRFISIGLGLILKTLFYDINHNLDSRLNSWSRGTETTAIGLQGTLTRDILPLVFLSKHFLLPCPVSYSEAVRICWDILIRSGNGICLFSSSSSRSKAWMLNAWVVLFRLTNIFHRLLLKRQLRALKEYSNDPAARPSIPYWAFWRIRTPTQDPLLGATVGL